MNWHDNRISCHPSIFLTMILLVSLVSEKPSYVSERDDNLTYCSVLRIFSSCAGQVLLCHHLLNQVTFTNLDPENPDHDHHNQRNNPYHPNLAF